MRRSPEPLEQFPHSADPARSRRRIPFARPHRIEITARTRWRRVGILYAALWLFWASRTPPARRAEAALRSLTAALILAPLLWEAAMHFQAIPNWSIAAVVVCSPCSAC
jgi:hypothetical protein